MLHDFRPPHPKKYAGDDWKQAWKNRLEETSKPWTKKWLEHQVYDDYWKQGSICEDWDKIQIPILAIGGWHDMYSNAVFRMVEKLPNCRGIIGPWSHNWPDEAVPGPQVCNKIFQIQFLGHFHFSRKMVITTNCAPKNIQDAGAQYECECSQS